MNNHEPTLAETVRDTGDSIHLLSETINEMVDDDGEICPECGHMALSIDRHDRVSCPYCDWRETPPCPHCGERCEALKGFCEHCGYRGEGDL